MSNFYAQICSNGHVLINRHPSDDNEYCEICGAKMLSKCPNCNSTFREWHYNGVTVLGSVKYERPNYCKSCGKAYPWTEAALQSTALLIQEEELSEQLKVSLVESLPDIITETPKTNLAVVRVKNVLQVPVNLLLMQSANLLSILVVNLPKITWTLISYIVHTQDNYLHHKKSCPFLIPNTCKWISILCYIFRKNWHLHFAHFHILDISSSHHLLTLQLKLRASVHGVVKE